MSEPKTTVRHRYCGLRDVYVAKVTQNDTEGYTAETPVKMARAIKAKISDKFTSEKLYSDDGVEGMLQAYEGIAPPFSARRTSTAFCSSPQRMKRRRWPWATACAA